MILQLHMLLINIYLFPGHTCEEGNVHYTQETHDQSLKMWGGASKSVFVFSVKNLSTLIC